MSRNAASGPSQVELAEPRGQHWQRGPGVTHPGRRADLEEQVVRGAQGEQPRGQPGHGEADLPLGQPQSGRPGAVGRPRAVGQGGAAGRAGPGAEAVGDLVGQDPFQAPDASRDERVSHQPGPGLISW